MTSRAGGHPLDVVFEKIVLAIAVGIGRRSGDRVANAEVLHLPASQPGPVMAGA